MKFTVLGCGSSMGVPMAGGFWGDCDPNEPRNERTRASLLVQSEKTNIIVDCTPDMRQHLNRYNIKTLDAALISHTHSDHVNGIEDFRCIVFHMKKTMDMYGMEADLDELDRRWPHLFSRIHGDLYPPTINKCPVVPYQHFRVGDINVETFDQDHSVCRTLGFRFGNVAYSPDMVDVDERALQVLKGIDTWIVDGGGHYKENPISHANIQRVKKWVEILKPKMTWITVMKDSMDYKTLCSELPPHIQPAYDGLVIEA